MASNFLVSFSRFHPDSPPTRTVAVTVHDDWEIYYSSQYALIARSDELQTDSEADIDDVWTNLAELEALAFAPVRFLYGGITEELLLRFGLMSALVLAGWYVTGRSVRTWLRSNLHYRIPLR